MAYGDDEFKRIELRDARHENTTLRGEVERLTRALGVLQIKCDKFQDEAAVAIDNQDDLRRDVATLTRERDEATQLAAHRLSAITDLEVDTINLRSERDEARAKLTKIEGDTRVDGVPSDPALGSTASSHEAK